MLNNAFIKIAEYISSIDITQNCLFEKHEHKKICNNIIKSDLHHLNYKINAIINDTTETIDIINEFNDHETNYLLAYKSLDGFDNLISNITIGSIYCLYEYDSNEKKIIKILKAGYCIYGFNTLLVETEINSVNLYKLNNNQFKYIKKIDLNKSSENIYSINEAYEYSPEINHLIRFYKSKNYKQRWVGTMVADCHRILLNDGVFMYPSSCKINNKKISLLYQGYPFAFIFEKAGGIAIDCNLNKILDKVNLTSINDFHIKTSIILCSNEKYIQLVNVINYFEENRY